MPTFQEPVHYHLRLLGPLQIERNGVPIGRLESRKALGLLCYLCCQRKPVPRAQLAALFWGEKAEMRGRGNLSRVLNSIAHELPGCIEANRHTIAFRHHDQFWVDIVQFDMLSASKKLHLMIAATELYRGEFLEDLTVKECPEFDLWLTAERERWRQRVAQFFQTVINHHAERGEYEQGLRFAARLLTLDPWSEEVHRQKMLLYHLSGQRTSALAQFELCKQMLADELGVEPSRETLLLRRQIEELNNSLATSIQQMLPREPLLERGNEHTWLIHRWEDARRGAGKFTLVEGEVGVGKTALIEEVLAWAASRGARVLRSRCYEYRSGLTYEAFVNALRPLFDSQQNILSKVKVADTWLIELMRLWPEVQRGLPPMPVFTDEEMTARHRLFEAIAQLLMATVEHEREVVLFLDDLHEADQPSLDLLRYLYHRLHTRAIWFVCAYRREETTPNHPLSLFRNVLTREGHLATTILKPLSSETVFQILRRYDGLTAIEIHRLGQFLQEQSEGNPFVLEQVRLALHDDQILSETEGVWVVDKVRLAVICQDGIEVPTAVAAVVENRLARLNPRARRLLHIGAAIGREFSLPLLMAVSGEPAEWVEICLSSWMARGLVVEMTSPEATTIERRTTNGENNHTYRFSHVMLWRVVLKELAPLQRLRLDERILDARNGRLRALPTPTTYSHVEELGD
jgi:DNA-binding SARP family transcriptional activator